MVKDYRQALNQSSSTSATVDKGLRAYMLRIYNLMIMALGVTALTSYAIVSTPALLQFTLSIQLFLALALIGFAFFVFPKIPKLSLPVAQACFWGFSIFMGLVLTPIFLVYTGTSVVRVLFICTSIFATMSLIGYTTKKDLTSMGMICGAGVIAVFIAAIVNFFILQSSMMDFIISVIAVIAISGLTAFDTQNIKHMYSHSDSSEVATRKSIYGAMHLYFNFIYMFIHLMNLLGERE